MEDVETNGDDLSVREMWFTHAHTHAHMHSTLDHPAWDARVFSGVPWGRPGAMKSTGDLSLTSVGQAPGESLVGKPQRRGCVGVGEKFRSVKLLRTLGKTAELQCRQKRCAARLKSDLELLGPRRPWRGLCGSPRRL